PAVSPAMPQDRIQRPAKPSPQAGGPASAAAEPGTGAGPKGDEPTAERPARSSALPGAGG
ncbi:MAG: polysaccharide deacetylase, partial [Pseudomonadota bacterium]|nr:polysaccharide deacetylase [Pseudomonadota bacterium]